jgi:hypothetical protein
MAVSLRNLLILDRYWLRRSRWVPMRAPQTWPGGMKAYQLLFRIPREIR